MTKSDGRQVNMRQLCLMEDKIASYLQLILKGMLDKVYSSIENTVFVLFKSLSQFISEQQRKK